MVVFVDGWWMVLMIGMCGWCIGHRDWTNNPVGIFHIAKPWPMASSMMIYRL
jgi:hypothetical protein